MIAVVGAVVTGTTFALFNDTETSTGNIFVAGSIDLQVDHTIATYDGQPCVSNCTETGGNLIVNGGFEDPVVTDHGGWWQTYPGGIPGWAVEFGALELQRNGIAGVPHGGSQLTELDSTLPSSISQIITTTPGGKYRLHFWFSPRPLNPSGDNGVGFQVQVVSPSSVILSDVVGSAQQGGFTTTWGEYVYDFIAVDASTKIVFTDLGSNTNSGMGGYIDDVSMYSLNCTGGFPYGGQCQLWNQRNLGPSDQFWNFPDVKPGDYGTDVVSLHVDSNDAFACVYGANIVDTDVTLTDPESTLADTLSVGELSPFIKVFAWDDANNNGLYEGGETTLIPVNTPLSNMATQMIALTLSGSGPAKYLGLAWCAGTQSIGAGPTINCDGSSVSDIAQTDSTTLDFTAYAVQQRNNPNFSCASLVQAP